MAAVPDWQLPLRQQLDHFSTGKDSRDLLWASGYMAGLAATDGAPAVAALDQEKPHKQALHIWYGSQTGNARGVAERLATAARAQSQSVELASLADVSPQQIRKVKLLSLVVSTHGDGEPPDDAEALRDWLLAKNAPRLESLRYTVFALGDSSYEHFCKTGHDFDAAFERLGAQRLLALHSADVNVTSAEGVWQPAMLECLAEQQPTATEAPRRTLQLVTPAPVAGTAGSRAQPVSVPRLTSTPLTVAPSLKTVHHVVVSIENSGLRYQPGDSLGVWPENSPQQVEEILQLADIAAQTPVAINGTERAAADWLRRELELTRLTKPLLKQYAAASGNDVLTTLLADAERLRAFITSHQVADLLLNFPARLPAEQLFAMLRPLTPRLYSIASSPLASPDEAHLTVRTTGGWHADGRLRAGAASWYLNSPRDADNKLRVFVEENPRFHLPETHTPIVMIGAGTGVVPFRAFVEQRRLQGDSGANWLIFGEQQRRCDFLYQLDWLRHLKTGALQKLSVAFSRDQAGKIYVQDRLREQGRELYAWLECGARVYVCGAADGMAPAVESALLGIIAKHGARSEDQARDYLQALKQQHRYRKDVY